MSQIRVIIQARTASRRLPGKALLPVAGHPAVVLAALRAGNQGHEIVVATSDDSSDDRLAQTLGAYRLNVIRGPLHDVLARFCVASSDLSDMDVVVRLTADNMVPDGRFVQELIESFRGSGLEYLSAASPQGRLPYGVSAEIFTVTSLREAQVNATSAYDREHVCPWMARNTRAGIFVPTQVGKSDYSHLRCTIDDQEDYQRILRLFENIRNPVGADWYELVQQLESLPEEPEFRVPYRVINGHVHSQMTLGTAQLGMEYGIVNRTGKPNVSRATTMIRTAVAHGVTGLDTARIYGDSEALIGDALTGAWASRVNVITKLDALGTLRHDASQKEVAAAVERSVFESGNALRVEKISTLLLHRWHHHHAWNGAVWRTLLRLRGAGKIERLGASVYEPQEAREALQDPDIVHLQIPFNILDRRWTSEAVQRAIASRPDVVVHARSIFLQGILLNPADCWPRPHGFQAALCTNTLRSLATRLDRESVADLCIAYARAQRWIASLVIGCETLPQLQQNLALFRTHELKAHECAEIEGSLPQAPSSLLNPSKWKLAHA